MPINDSIYSCFSVPHLQQALYICFIPQHPPRRDSEGDSAFVRSHAFFTKFGPMRLTPDGEREVRYDLVGSMSELGDLDPRQPLANPCKHLATGWPQSWDLEMDKFGNVGRVLLVLL